MDIWKKRLDSDMPQTNKKEFLWYFAGIVFTVLYCFYSLKLWNYDLTIPLWYRDRDNLFTALTVKRLQEGLIINPNLGAPFEALYIDFPLYGDYLNILFLKVLLFLTGNVGVTINTFFIALFPLTFCISFFVMRRCEVSAPLAFGGSVLYSFLPYRFLRNTMHLFLSNYSFVPLTIYFCYCLYTDSEAFSEKKRWPLYFLALITVALNGIYYAFFSCFLILLTIIVVFFRDHKIPLAGVLGILGTVLIIGIAMLPYIGLKGEYGTNIESPTRSPLEAEYYGLKIAQFFIPNQSHSVSLLEKLINGYANAPLPNEGSEYLGIVGVIGLCLSLLLCFLTNVKNQLLSLLSKLNLGAILLGTIGGFGSLFAIVVSPQLRCYNRISVFVAFCSILTFVVIVTVFAGKAKHKLSIYLAVIVLIAFSLREQSFFDHGELQMCADSYQSDDVFVKEIEEYASDGAMIYQLPYFRFPETPPMNLMGDYALARGYIHSDNLRWSYGDYKGRTADLWNRSLSEKSIEEQIKSIVVMGFEGIYIDTYAYTQEELAELCDGIEAVIGDCVKFISPDGRLMFYGLKEWCNELTKKYSPDELKALRDKLSITVGYNSGLSTLESSGEDTWRWCDKSGVISVTNISDNEISVSLSAIAKTGYEDFSTLTIQCGEELLEYSINADGKEIAFEFHIPPGKTDIKFNTDAPKVYAPSDSRSLYFSLFNMEINTGMTAYEEMAA